MVLITYAVDTVLMSMLLLFEHCIVLQEQLAVLQQIVIMILHMATRLPAVLFQEHKQLYREMHSMTNNASVTRGRRAGMTSRHQVVSGVTGGECSLARVHKTQNELKLLPR